MIHYITITMERFLGNSSWKRMKSQSVFRQEGFPHRLSSQKINLKTTLEFIIGDSQRYFSGLIGATRPIVRTFVAFYFWHFFGWWLGHFLLVTNESFYNLCWWVVGGGVHLSVHKRSPTQQIAPYSKHSQLTRIV